MQQVLFMQTVPPSPGSPTALPLAFDRGLLACSASVVLSIGAAALLAAIHAHLLPMPRSAFIVAQLVTLAAVVSLIARWLKTVLQARPALAVIRLLPLALFVGLASSMMLSGFSRHDEIYSWNLWAIQHFSHIPYDRTYTQAAYPQLYAYWLASIYGAQGQFESQLLTRFASAIPSLVMIGVAGAFWPQGVRADRRSVTIAALVTLLVLLGTFSTLRLSYADPLMTAALLTSAALLLCHASAPSTLVYLVPGVTCGVIAALTKQPAILWAGGILPLAVAGGVWRRSWPWRSLLIAALGAAVTGSWLLLELSAMLNNQGVVQAGLGDRGLMATAAKAGLKYLIKKPHLLLLLSAGWYVSRRDAWLHALWWLGVLPMLALWFTLGSYEARHGTHVLWFSALILLAALSLRPTADTSMPSFDCGKIAIASPLTMVGSFLVIALTFGLTFSVAHRKGLNLFDGQRLAWLAQISPQGLAFFDAAIRKQSRIWTTSNYNYGIFYGRLPVGRPSRYAPDSTPLEIARELQDFHADFAISAGRFAYGVHSSLLLRLVEACPNSLHQVLVSDDGEFVVFSVNQNELPHCVEELNARVAD